MSTGGTMGSGGNASAGGSKATGGTPSSGGTTSPGGKTGSGGTVSSGGIVGSGGAVSSGGNKASGGATSTSDASALGGTTSSGGDTSAGGSKATGGTTMGAGGIATTGGNQAMGGTTGSGGNSSTATVCSATSATLKTAGDCNKKLIGCALTTSHLSDSSYTTAAKEHNFVTPENEMKWDTVEASRGSFNYGPGDQIVNFAVQNGMKVKGHTLVWHSQLPGWVSSLGSATDVRSVMLNHIKNVAGHYKGKVAAWDVVNEAWETTSKKGDGTATLGNDVFNKYLGASYIDEAFTAARAADPDALLFYNDYSSEGMNDKANAIYKMVSDMVSRGIPIDGVGMQMHIGSPNDTPTAAEIAQNMKRIADLGLKIAISEMDVNCCDGYSLDQEATIYHDIVAACAAQTGCWAITFWGLSDKYSWLNSFGEAGCNGKPATPLLWNDSYAKKPAYTSVIKALTGN